MRHGSILRAIALQTLKRPRLIGVMVRTAWTFRASDWYRKPPFLPLPPREYVAWRLDTAYGSGRDADPSPAEIEKYVRWAAAQRRARDKES